MPPHDHHELDDKSASGELQFINLSSNYNGDPNTKKVVRKHVMTKFRRDQRKEQSSNASEPKPHGEAVAGKKSKLPKPDKVNITTIPHSFSQSTRIRLIDRSPLDDFPPRQLALRRIRRCREVDIRDDHQQDTPESQAQLVRLPPTILGAGRVDPLNSLPIQNSPPTAYLLDQFNQFITWRRSHLPNTLFANFFRYSLTDPALAHAMMIYAANHDQFFTGKPRMVEIYHHKVEAIRILNSRLRSSTLNMSDETIVTIAGLVIFEEMFGSSESASTHRAGLQQLVQLRGGIQKLGTPYVSVPFVGQALILPTSVSSWEQAYHTRPTHISPYITPPPRTPSPPAYSMSIPSKTLKSTTSTTITTSYLSTCECSVPHSPYPPSPSGWDEIMKETFVRLKDSSSLLSSTLHTEHHLSIHNESYLVESRIMQLIQGFETEDRSDKSRVKVVYGKSWVLGCRLYLYTVLRCSETRPVRSHVLQGLIEELRQSLSDEFLGYSEVYEFFNGGREYDVGVTTKNFHEKYYSPNVLLWVLLVGGSNALTLPQTTPPSPLQNPTPTTTSSSSISPITTPGISSSISPDTSPNISSTITPNISPGISPNDLSWFLSATKHLSLGLKINEWAGVKRRMQELPWVEWKIEEGYRRFWEGAVFGESDGGDRGVWTVFHKCGGRGRGRGR